MTYRERMTKIWICLIQMEDVIIHLKYTKCSCKERVKMKVLSVHWIEKMRKFELKLQCGIFFKDKMKIFKWQGELNTGTER